MFCKNCGTQVEENQKFCSNCGTPVDAVAATEDKVQNEASAVKPAPSAQAKTATPANGDDKKIILQIFAGIFALMNLIMFLSGFFGFFYNVFNYIRRFKYSSVMYKIFDIPLSLLKLVNALSLALIAVVLIVLLLKWKKEESRDFFITLAEVSILPVILSIIIFIVSFMSNIGHTSIISSLLSVFGLFWPILRALITCGGFFGILYLMNINPLEGVTKDNIKQFLISAPKTVLAAAKSIFKK